MPKKAPSEGPNLLKRAQEAPDLAAVLSILNEAKGQDHAVTLLTPVLNILERKAADDQTGARSGEVLQAAEELFQLAAKSNGGKHPESLVTIMVRICCKGGAPQRALCLIEDALLAGTKLKLRTLAVILAQAAETGDRATCEGVWKRLGTLQLEPQDSEFALMLRSMRSDRSRQLEILRQLLDELPLPHDPPLIEELGRIFGVAGVADLLGASTPFADGLKEDTGVWRVGWSSIDDRGCCSLSKRQLQAFDISPTEEEELLRFIPRLTNESTGFRPFLRWLSSQEPFDAIIDGANVGFNNQNHDDGQFQYDQIEAVVQHFRSRGQRALLVLHPKWLKEDTNLRPVKRKRIKFDKISSDAPTPEPGSACEESSPDEEPEVTYPHDGITDAERDAPPGSAFALIRSWKERNVICIVPFWDCDDWYWLYAALDSFRRGKRAVQVVSNDQMRDHHWRMFNGRSLVRWQERHMTRFSMHFEANDVSSLTFNTFAIRPYSTCAQVSADGRTWHFPVPAIRSRAEQLSSGRP
eukprot:CAMPEP_0169127954 /NCGR_PEP_ID=MMETSP1015-20121227/36297_1 /TAXON_ID=342587 /ORGANISM="Karlodinium micrum, Strain CCMP2283" /LENGTH=524 /DNA_ID=CAMNT_0009191799 /DNA_START=51 /DNA_END=1621 /DNA_ORIENTATION=-